MPATTSGWSGFAARAESTPGVLASSGSPYTLQVFGNGVPNVYGGWRARLQGLSGGNHYRFRARVIAQDTPPARESVTILLRWRGSYGDEVAPDYVWEYRVQPDGSLFYDRTLQAPAGTTAVDVELIRQWAPNGRVQFDSLSFVASDPRAARHTWATADAFGYASTTLTGNGQIIARVASVQNVNAWTKAGVMVRNGLAGGAAHAFMIQTPTTTKGTAFQRRSTANGTTTNTAGPAVAPPYWVKLVHSGNTIAAAISPNGTTWTAVGTDTIVMGTTINVGLAVSSHVAGNLATATFDNVTVTASP